MSSPRKDARWQLAKNMVGVHGWDYENFDYRTWQAVLDAAELILQAKPEMIPLLAEDFNDPDYD